MKSTFIGIALGFTGCALVVVLMAADFSPTRAKAGRDVYYPASEDLAQDEMRCGSAEPS